MVVDVKETTIPLDEGDYLMRVEKVAKVLDVSPKQVRRWIDDGSLRKVTLGPKIVRVRRSTVDAFMDEHDGPWQKQAS